MASKSATTLASSPPKPSTVAPTSVWSLLGEQGFETSAFSSFFEPSVAEGKESIELPKGCGAHLLYGVAPHELSTAVQAYSELLSLKLAYHQPEEEEPSRRANTELGRLLRYHGDVKGQVLKVDELHSSEHTDGGTKPVSIAPETSVVQRFLRRLSRVDAFADFRGNSGYGFHTSV